MKLGKKGKDVESFVDKLVAEGESRFLIRKCCQLACYVFPGVTSAAASRQPAAVTKSPPQTLQER